MDSVYSPLIWGMLGIIAYVLLIALFARLYEGLFKDTFVVIYAVLWPLSGTLVLLSVILMFIFDEIIKKTRDD